MGSHEDTEEAEARPPKLQLFSSLSSTTLKSSPQIQQTTSKFLHTPPHHALASIPFKWEEEPGKPRPCKTLSLPSSTTTTKNNNSNNDDNYIKCLELPPRLLNEIKYTNTPSPTTVLEGPYTIGKSIFHSFRLIRSGRHEGGGGGGYNNYDGESNCSPERGLLGTTSLMGNSSGKKLGKGGGSWRKKNGFGIGSKSQKDFLDKGSLVPEDEFDGLVEDGDSGGPGGGGGSDTRVKVTRISRKKNVLGFSQSRSHFWAAMYGALKQVIPRRRGSSTKWKN